MISDCIPNESYTMSLFRLMYSDYRRYIVAGETNPLHAIFATQGLWASSVYRVSHWLFVNTNVPILRGLVLFGCQIASKITEVLTGISLSYRCTIGQGLYIGHFGNIFVGAPVRIGSNCNLSQGVTIGIGGRGTARGVPVIGDRVHVGPNAVVAGKITIGNDVAIGACTVVTRSIPDRAVVIGNPSSIVWYDGSFPLVSYDGMDEDPQRVASQAKVKPSDTSENA